MSAADTGHVVLVGAGHANLLVVRAARRLRDLGIAVTLVDPDAFWYSGMAAAVVGDAVHPGRDRVDPAPLAASRDVRFVAGHVVALDLVSRAVTLDDGTVLDATAVVLNVGSEVDLRGLPADRDDVTPVKPTRGLLGLRDRLATGPTGPRVVIVGGGASAVEVAGNLSAGRLARHVRPHVTVVAPEAPVPSVADDVRAHMLDTLAGRGVVLDVGRRAVDVTDAGVVLDDGAVLPADHVVLATGLRSAPLVRELGVGDERGMPTTATLQHPDHPWLLGAGDAIRFGADGLPRLGVFAVRQAPVLVENLRALHGHGELRSYLPQTSWVAAVDLGGGEAVVMREGRWFAGRLALVVKRLLDEWFLRRHRVPAASSGRSWGRRAT